MKLNYAYYLAKVKETCRPFKIPHLFGFAEAHLFGVAEAHYVRMGHSKKLEEIGDN